MAAGNWKLYDTAKLKIGQGIIDLDGHTFKMALFQSTSNCDTLTHDELADLTNQVANGFGYTTGGETLTGVTWTNLSGVSTFDCANVSWLISGGTVNFKFAVIYDDTVAGDPLVCVSRLDISGLSAISGKEIIVVIDPSGVFTMSGATTN